MRRFKHTCRRLFLLTACSVFTLAVAATAAEQTAPIDLRPHWKVGDQVTYAIERIKTTQRSGAGKSEMISRYKITVSVVEVNTEGIVQNWIVETDPLEQITKEFDAPLILLHALSSLTLVLQLDTDAGVVAVKNWREVRSKIQLLLSNLDSPGLMNPSKRKAVELYKNIFVQLLANEAQVLFVLTKEAQILFSPMGGLYSSGVLIETASAIETPFFAEGIPATYRITPLVRSDRPNILVLEVVETPDTTELAVFSKTKDPVSLMRTVNYEIDIPTAWPVSVLWQQKLIAPGQERFESMRFDRLK